MGAQNRQSVRQPHALTPTQKSRLLFLNTSFQEPTNDPLLLEQLPFMLFTVLVLFSQLPYLPVFWG